MADVIPISLSKADVRLIDELVAAGVGKHRTDVIRRGLFHLVEARRAEIGEVIVASYQRVPQSAPDDAMAFASAHALIDAEPW